MGWLLRKNHPRPGRRRPSSLDVSTHPSPTIQWALRKQQQQQQRIQLEQDPAAVGLEKISSVSCSNNHRSHHTSSTSSSSCLDVSDRTSSSSTSTLQTALTLPLDLQEEHLLDDEDEEKEDHKHKEEEVSSAAAAAAAATRGAEETATTVSPQVRFGKVQTRYYAPCPTDNPSVLCGVPIGLDWTILSQEEAVLPTGDNDIHSTTTGGLGYRRSYTELRLTSMERMERLRSFGYARSDLATVELQVNRARQQRERTVQQVLRRAHWKRNVLSLFSAFGSTSNSTSSSKTSSAPRGRRKKMPMESMF